MSEDTIETANRRVRLQLWIDDECEGSQSRFIEITDINQGELSGLLKKKSFGEKKARKLEGQAGMPNRYLDQADNTEDVPSQHATHYPRMVNRNIISIRQHDDVHGAMGHGTILDGDENGTITSWRVTKQWATQNLPSNTGLVNLRIVTGKGDSMKGMYNDGDPLIIDTGVTTVDFDAVYFFRIGERGFIKRLQRMADDTILAISENSKYRDMVITKDDDLHLFGRVLKAWSGEIF